MKFAAHLEHKKQIVNSIIQILLKQWARTNLCETWIIQYIGSKISVTSIFQEDARNGAIYDICENLGCFTIYVLYNLGFT